jgi:anaerobic selenocysteine-containing dehydrogenase
VDLVQIPLRQFQGHYGLYKSRVRGLPEFGGELPVATMAEEIETEGEGQIRALVTSAGNPVLSAPNGARLERALPKLEFMASIDFYLNETTRHAHVILPPTGPLEHDHYDLALHLLQVRNTAKYSKAVFPRPAEARHDWEILGELTWRLANGPLTRLAARAQAETLRRLEPKGILDLMLRAGPRGDRFSPLKKGLSRKALEDAPHGIDLGGLEPRFPERLGTPDKKIVLAPRELVADLARLEKVLQDDESHDQGLVLIGRRQLRSNNSWMHNSVRLVKGPVRCTLQMNPEDAQKRGLQHGELVQIRSRVGSVQAPLEVTEALMPGVVSLPHGWGHTRKGTKLSVAEQHPGASINDVTDESRVDALAGTASFSGLPVDVQRAG